MTHSMKITLALVALLLITPGAYAQDQNYQDHRALVDLVDHRVDKVLRERKQNHQAQEKVRQWKQEAGAWIDQHNSANMALSRARKRAGNYATMTDGQLQSEITTLEVEFAAIDQPPGGRVIGDTRYLSFQDVLNDIPPKSKELTTLQYKDHDLYQKLVALDAQRDAHAREAEVKSGEVVNENKKIARALRERYTRYSNMVNDPTLWCEQHYNMTPNFEMKPGPIVCSDRKMAMIDLTLRYRAEMIRQGIPYDPEVVKKRIRGLQTESIQTKKILREKMLPELDKAINHAVKEERKALNPPIELAGCWLMLDTIGDDDAMLTVKEGWDGVYEGEIIRYGWTDLPDGHVLFKVKRVNNTTFDGTEFSIINNQGTQTPLRIIVDRKRQSATYRTSDDLLPMSPCD